MTLDTTFENMQLRSTAPTEVLTAVRRLVLGNRWVGAATGLWICGLLVVFVLPAPVAITPEKMARFEQRMYSVHAAEKQLGEVENELFTADSAYRSEAGYFPWFASQEQKEVISQFRERRDTLQEEVAHAQNTLLLEQRKANKQLGLFSSHGIDEAKSRFWSSFEKAKIIGRRNTFMDGIFAIIFNRDLELMDMILRLAMYLVLNTTFAMFFMFFIFVFKLPSYIWTFGATWYESSLFFVLSVVGAASVMATFCALVTAAAGGSVYALSRMTGRVGWLQGPTADGRRRLRMDVAGYSATDFGHERYYRANRRPQGGGAAGQYAAGGAGGGGGQRSDYAERRGEQHPHNS